MAIRTATAHLHSTSPYSPSRVHEAPKLDRETHDAYERRTWQQKAHVTKDGIVFIPPMAFKQSLDKAAQMLGLQIPGKGKSTYTKFFLSGVIAIEPVLLNVKQADLPGERIYANSDGKRGSGKRVWRWFPRVDSWKAQISYTVFSDEITTDVFAEVLQQSAAFVGVGRFRPENGGFYGRFAVDRIKWETAATPAIVAAA